VKWCQCAHHTIPSQTCDLSDRFWSTSSIVLIKAQVKKKNYISHQMKFICWHYCHVSYLNVFFFKCFVTTTIFPSMRPIYCITKWSVHVSWDYSLVSVEVVDGQWAQCILSSIFTTSIYNIFLPLFVTLSCFSLLYGWEVWNYHVLMSGGYSADKHKHYDFLPYYVMSFPEKTWS